MRLAYMFFVIAILCALSGMGLGLFMGLARDHSLMPVHAHGNLLGFVTMFLCGLYYRVEPGAVSRLAYGHFIIAVTGFALMIGGLAFILLGDRRFLPVAIAGAVLSLLAMVLFLVIVGRRALPAWSAPRASGSVVASPARAGLVASSDVA
jgi:phosphatidylglycerophosphate synthase